MEREEQNERLPDPERSTGGDGTHGVLGVYVRLQGGFHEELHKVGSVALDSDVERRPAKLQRKHRQENRRVRRRREELGGRTQDSGPCCCQGASGARDEDFKGLRQLTVRSSPRL